MNKSKIEWCDMTWNPVTGCLHGCDYCYARRIAERFGSVLKDDIEQYRGQILHIADVKKHCPYPFIFEPTLHKYRLDEPIKKTKPQNIFVCSMADLFGKWVPDEWIQQVFDACRQAKQHKYIFLTKNPDRYCSVYYQSPEHSSLGTTITCQKDIDNIKNTTINYIDFLSIEPLKGEVNLERFVNSTLEWVIVGAQTGQGAKPPQKEWVLSIIDQCRDANVPVFLKNNINWHERIQEYPEGV